MLHVTFSSAVPAETHLAKQLPWLTFDASPVKKALYIMAENMALKFQMLDSTWQKQAWYKLSWTLSKEIWREEHFKSA